MANSDIFKAFGRVIANRHMLDTALQQLTQLPMWAEFTDVSNKVGLE